MPDSILEAARGGRTMQKYSEMSKEQLQAVKKELDQQYAEIKAQGLALDMSRGKPSNAQLELSFLLWISLYACR